MMRSRFLRAARQSASPLLLDTYTGAIVAFSVRKLRTAYAGSCLRVRRSSDSTEQDIGFDGSGYIDTASLLSFCGAGDGLVTTWYDQSTNNKSALQPTATQQPAVVLGGALVTDGLAAIDFDGTDNRMQTAALAAAVSQPISWSVSANDPAVANDTFFDGRGNSNRFALYRLETTARMSLNTQTSVTLSESSAFASGKKLITGVANTTASEIRINGASRASGNAGTGTLDGVTLGSLRGIGTPVSGAYYLDGTLQEIILWPSDRTSDFAAIEANVNAYFTIY